MVIARKQLAAVRMLRTAMSHQTANRRREVIALVPTASVKGLRFRLILRFAKRVIVSLQGLGFFPRTICYPAAHELMREIDRPAIPVVAMRWLRISLG